MRARSFSPHHGSFSLNCKADPANQIEQPQADLAAVIFSESGLVALCCWGCALRVTCHTCRPKEHAVGYPTGHAQPNGAQQAHGAAARYPPNQAHSVPIERKSWLTAWPGQRGPALP